MASIGKDENGRKRILFVAKDGKRKTVRLGKVPLKVAEEVQRRVEMLNAAAISRTAIDGDTAAWLGSVGEHLHAKLASVGLVERREPAEPQCQACLGTFLDAYMAGRTDIKPSTRCNLTVCKARLVEFFGADKVLEEVTVADAKRWDIWLKDRYAKATIGRTIRRAKQFFQAAIDGEVISKNPFAKIKAPGQANEARQRFITLETTYKVLDACPDAEWRLLFALSRFGGMRCPSEHLALTWPDVDWERNRFRVVSPKKEHLEGEGVRWVPLFPELRPYLEEAFELAPEGSVYVINRHRDARVNLRTQLLRIIRKAALNPWPKLFQNLRSSRETELAKDYPIHVVCNWIGNTAAIAQKHYLQVTDADFNRASSMPVQRGTESGTVAAQNAAQQAAAAFRTVSQEKQKTPENPGFLQDVASACETVQSLKAPRVGLEPTTNRLTAGCSTIELSGKNTGRQTLLAVVFIEYDGRTCKINCRGTCALPTQFISFNLRGFMRLATIQTVSGPRAAVQVGTSFVDVNATDSTLPERVRQILGRGPAMLKMIEQAVQRPDAVKYPAAEVKLLPPIPNPAKIVCIGLNYRDHAAESGAPIPKDPVLFSKYATALIGHGAAIVLPPVSSEVDFEAELVIVVGKRGKNLTPEQAAGYVAGYTIGHDVSARDWQLKKDGKQWMVGKTFDTFAPTGPVLVTADEVPDPHKLAIKLRLNGQTMQDSNTSQMIFSVGAVLAYLSQVFTLEPGDLVFTGTPPGVGFARKPPVFLKGGDVVEVEIEGLGVLRNPVVQG